jgi:hypothetical protein
MDLFLQDGLQREKTIDSDAAAMTPPPPPRDRNKRWRA